MLQSTMQVQESCTYMYVYLDVKCVPYVRPVGVEYLSWAKL